MLAVFLRNRKAASLSRGGGFSFGSFLDEPNDTRPAYTPGEPRPGAPRVSEPRPAQINTYQLGTVEVTAPREPDYNPTVAVVGKREMQTQGSLDAAQALRFTPGVFYSPTTGQSISTIYVRGFNEEEMGYYFDGIPISDLYAGGASGTTDLFPFFSFGLSEIQLSKGYTSPVFSGGKMGGAINMVSSVPVRNLEFKLNYQFTANNEHRTNVQVGRNFGSDYFQLTFSHLDRKSLHYSYDYSKNGPQPIPNTATRGYMLIGKYGFFLGDNHEYSANFYHQHRAFDNWMSFPYYDKTAFYVLGDSKFNDMVSLNSKVWYHMNTNISTGARGSKYDDYSVGITETAKFDFSEDQNFKLGFLVKNDNHKADDFVTRGTSTVDSTKRKYNVLNSSVFAEYALRANDMFRFALSGSYDRHDGIRIDAKTYAQRRQDAPMHKYKNKHLLGWTLQGIAYFNPIEPLTFHANVGHKTNIPKMSSLYDYYGETAASSDLSNESLMNYELGVDFNHIFELVGTSSFGATAYFNDINNMIVTLEKADTTLCSNPSTSGTCTLYDNADGGYSYGGEIYAKQGFFGDRLVLGANWSYIQRKSYTYNDDGSRLAVSEFTTHPRQNININILVAPRQDYDISFNGSVQTSRYARVNNGTSAAPSYDYVRIPTVVYFDMVANYHMTKRLKLTAGAYNLFDRNYNYETSYADAVAGGLPGRRVFAGFEYNYGK